MSPRLLASFLAAICGAPLGLAAQQRELDPVIVEGSALPTLLGQNPSRIAGFRYQGGWVQIPVQIDERAVVSFGQIRGGNFDFSTLVYTDANTLTGADPDASFDADDELVLLARDAGGPGGFGDPPGTVPGTQVGLKVTDPLGSEDRYVYLYVHDGSLDPSAGRNYVDYTFNLLSGDYLQTYNLGTGFNPEDSVAVTSAYRMRFTDRWVNDELVITTPGATGDDVLDWHGIERGPGDCGNTTVTFSRGGGAFIANIDGPIRAVRSIVGAESGVIAQRDWKFYPARIDITFFVRVHPLCCSWDVIDYSTDAVGMTYYDNLNQGGVVIDGVPDTIATGVLHWQLMTGAQGSLTHVFTTKTDISQVNETSHYFDDLTPSFSQCTGDGRALGVSGTQIENLPNTDPLLGAASQFEQTRTIYVESPGVDIQHAAALRDQVLNPLQTRTTSRYRTIGVGCLGSTGTPFLDAAGVFEIGTSVTFRITWLRPRQPGALFFGFSPQQPPVDLTQIGMPGCFQYVDLDVAIITESNDSGIAEVTTEVPSDPSLIGLAVYQQYAGMDTRATPLGWISANAGELIIGG